jgi:hypothetical protein
MGVEIPSSLTAFEREVKRLIHSFDCQYSPPRRYHRFHSLPNPTSVTHNNQLTALPKIPKDRVKNAVTKGKSNANALDQLLTQSRIVFFCI